MGVIAIWRKRQVSIAATYREIVWNFTLGYIAMILGFVLLMVAIGIAWSLPNAWGLPNSDSQPGVIELSFKVLSLGLAIVGIGLATIGPLVIWIVLPAYRLYHLLPILAQVAKQPPVPACTFEM